MGTKNQQLKVLHLINRLACGGLETWIMEMARKRNRDELQIDVCQIDPQLRVGAYEEEFEKLGGRIHRCPLRKNIFAFNSDFKKILIAGNYDILHSHHYFASGYFLKIAKNIPNLKLVAHMHPTADMAQDRVVFPRSLYQFVMKRWIKTYADAILGASNATLDTIWGTGWRDNPRIHFQPNGIDMALFEQDVDPLEMRNRLGLNRNSKIILTVGRHVKHKNHILIPEIARLICRQEPEAYFVINGVGPLREIVEKRVAELGLSKKFRFLDGMPNLVPLWKSSDVFLFPSLMEGFGIVVIEAAAAGLPVVAHQIPGVMEAATACHKAILLPTGTSPSKWSESVLTMLDTGRLVGDKYLKHKQNFKFTTENSLRCLLEVYRQLTAGK